MQQFSHAIRLKYSKLTACRQFVIFKLYHMVSHNSEKKRSEFELLAELLHRLNLDCILSHNSEKKRSEFELLAELHSSANK